METVQKIHHDLTQEIVREISTTRNEPAWLLQKRLDALKKFHELDMPRFKYGMTVKMNSTGLDLGKINFKNLVKSRKREFNTNDNVVILNFEDALKDEKYSKLIEEHFFSTVKGEDKIFTLHKAVFNAAVFVFIPKNTKIIETIKIDFGLEEDAEIVNVLVVGEESSEATIVENVFTNSEDEKYRSSIIEVVAKNNSRINYASAQHLNESSYNFSYKTSKIGKDAEFNWVDSCMGSKFSHTETTSVMKGAGSKTNNWGMFYAENKQQFGIHANTIHEVEHTVSDMLTKGVIDDNAKVIYEGLIHIKQNAPHSNGYQKSEAILLKNTAEADMIPILEIDNNEVRCTHGSTVGQLDKEKMFYLQCRGLDDKTAKKELVRGFYEQMFHSINIPSLTNILRKIIYKRIGVEKTEIWTEG
jgi:Fe-S cluster assembly protein SufD